MSTRERFWTRRLRWRLRGAWQWPTFAVLTLVDGLIIDALSPTGADVDLLLGIIFASFGNLILVGVVGPWLARRLVERQRRAESETGGSGPPGEVVHDRTATALLCVGTLALLVSGLALQPTIVSETEASEENARLVRDYVQAQGSEELQRNLGTANTIRIAEGYFRTCIALDDRTSRVCLLVDTNSDPPQVDEDSNTIPNEDYIEQAEGA
ncbi:MAG TPA: hypothetical protein VGR10_07025 [Thermoleophilaceae bacterium]|nr:hypothetical protein [Thermoleophilaceae bacterium]